MREYPAPTVDSRFLSTGLRADYRAPINAPHLLEALNVRCHENGISPYEPMIQPFGDSIALYGIEMSWPFPMIFRGKSKTFLVDRSAIFYVNEGDWTLWEMQTFDAANPTVTKAIQPGRAWSFVDFFDTWFFSNGINTVFHSNRHLMKGEEDKIYVFDRVRIEAGCDHRGRALFGGFEEEYFWSDEWKNFYETEAKKASTGLSIKLSDLRENFVMWSTIGGGDLLFLFHQDLAETGFMSSDYGSGDELIWDFLRRNEWGFMPMAWQGKVREIKPFGKSVIVYGDGGVTALTPYQDPTPTYGAEELSTIGIHNTGAVGGDDKTHLYLDQGGALWLLESGSGLKKLGYESIFGLWNNDTVLISFNSREREFWISNGIETYYLSRTGLSKTSQIVSSIAGYTQGYHIGLGSLMEDEDQSFKIKTGTFDLGSRGLKTITEVELGIDSTVDVYVSIEFRYEKNGQWMETVAYPVNSEGIAYPRVECLEFRVIVSGSDYRSINLDYVNVFYQKSDKRGRRGLDASPANT